MGAAELGELLMSSLNPATAFFFLNLNATMPKAPKMMKPPTPTTTPIIVFLVLVEIPPPSLLSFLELSLRPVGVVIEVVTSVEYESDPLLVKVCVMMTTVTEGVNDVVGLVDVGLVDVGSVDSGLDDSGSVLLEVGFVVVATSIIVVSTVVDVVLMGVVVVSSSGGGVVEEEVVVVVVSDDVSGIDEVVVVGVAGVAEVSLSCLLSNTSPTISPTTL